MRRVWYNPIQTARYTAMRRRQSKAPTRKVLTFSYQNVVGNSIARELHLGLGIEDIQRVVRLPQIHKTPESPLAIATIEHEQVLVLDLYYNLFRQELTNEGKKYLIAVRSEDILYGIPVSAVPILREVLETEFQLLPAEYRVHDSLGIASHIFNIENQTFFLLHPPSLMEALIGHQSIANSLLAISDKQSQSKVLSREGQGELTLLLNSFTDNVSESENLVRDDSSVVVDFNESSDLQADDMVMMDFADFTEESASFSQTENITSTTDEFIINDFNEEPEPAIETETLTSTEDEFIINDFNEEPEPAIEHPITETINETAKDMSEDTIADLEQKPIQTHETLDHLFSNEPKNLSSDATIELAENEMEVDNILAIDNLFE